jgi:hypothetical protein
MLDLRHAYICGPINIASLVEAKYFLPFIDGIS